MQVADAAKSDNQQEDPKAVRSGSFKVAYLALSFMTLFTAFNSAQNMVAMVYGELGPDFKYCGNIALFTLYIVFGFSCLFSPMVVAKYSFKLTFIISALGYNLWVAVGYLAVHCP